MSVTFKSVTVPIPQSQTEDVRILMKETVLLSGELSVQASTHYGINYSFTCIGSSSQYSALIAEIGARGTLVINGSSYPNYFIKSLGPVTKNNMTNYFNFNIGFVQAVST